jgi:hypothetical protein
MKDFAEKMKKMKMRRTINNNKMTSSLMAQEWEKARVGKKMSQIKLNMRSN